MKRFVILILALALLLCGCGSQVSQPAAVPGETQHTDAQPAAITLYNPNDPVEAETEGAVRAYPLGDGDYTHIVAMGEKLLVVSAGGDITMLQGDAGEIVATVTTDLGLVWGTNDLQSGRQSVGYYAAATREVVILDDQLRESYRVQLPDTMEGRPVVQLTGGEVFYCAGSEIRAIHIQTGLSRLVRTQVCTSQELLGSYFEDSVLACLVIDAQGSQNIVYLDAKTGEQLDLDPDLGKLYTHDQNFFARVPEGDLTRLLFGTRNAEVMSLDVVPQEQVLPVLGLQGALRHETTETGLFLEFYDLAAGRITAQTQLPGISDLTAVTVCGDYIWFLSGKTLYRWDISLHPVAGSPVCTSQLFTRENPDQEGLAACQERADTLSQTYGFTLDIWEDAVKPLSSLGAVSEYQVSIIHTMLDQLEPILEQLPSGFLKTTGDVRVCLVRNLESGEARAVHWADGACHIVLTPEDTANSFLWGLGNAVDTRVLGNSFDYDKWDDLNPWWFDYTYDYEKNNNRSNPSEFLEGSGRAFTDLTAMSFPTEDRSRIFANAMMPDNADVFTSDILQKKLRCICIAIREAYLLEDVPEVFPWEQYLKKPIAPTN